MSEKKQNIDYILWGSALIIILGLAAGFFLPHIQIFHDFAYAIAGFIKRMWWGVALGIIFVGIMGKIPQGYFYKILGPGDKISGIFRAVLAGLFLDLCSHGILLVGAKLYERGASLAQVMAFLIASPWNSISLTLILVGLIGWELTFMYIAGSAVIALITGLIYVLATKRGVFAENPNRFQNEDGQDLPPLFSELSFSLKSIGDVLISGIKDVRTLIKWLLLGVVIAAALQAFVPQDSFSAWFGPTVMGLGLTLLAATIIEVCSEGSAPIASELVTSAGAPGNGFAFLMAGVSTDYTEIMIIRGFSKSWWVALSLPLFTLPQILFIGWILNGI